MFLFVLICVGLLAIAVVWLVVPLLRARHAAAIDRSAVNAGILKDQLVELERDRQSGALNETSYAEARAELERRVLEEVPGDATASTTAAAVPAGARRAAIAIALVVPVAAIALYFAFGDRNAFDPEITQAKTPQELVQLLAGGEPGIVIDKINTQLKRDPKNGELLFILARAYYARQQFIESAAAYERLNQIEADDPTLLTDWADVIAQAQGRSMKGRPEALIDRALAIEPDNGKALAMSGAAAFERQDYVLAVSQWEKLRSRAAGTELAAQIEQSIAQARAAGKLKASPVTAKKGTAATVSGRVSLGAQVAKSAAPTDTVFIVARAAAGPRTPLAVYRMQAKDLPAKFSLDDSQAMAPNLKLSAFNDVVVNARVSKSGNAIAQAGDLETAPMNVKVGAKDLALVIDRVRP